MVAMHVLTAAEMKACDRLTTERFGIPSLDLMRHAAMAVANFAREQFPHARRVTVLCGRGNNGGDGMMVARLLAIAGLEVTTLLLGARDGLSGDAAEAWRELTSPAHGLIHVIHEPADLSLYNEALTTDLLIDAVVGTGFKPPLKGLALAGLEWVKSGFGASAAPILAIDLPSGWPADASSSSAPGLVFPADAVITFTALKPAHLFGQLTRRWSQPVVVAPIGSPEKAITASLSSDSPRLCWSGSSLAMTQTPRAVDANKGNFGHVLIVGGSVGKSGAPAMASLAALRSGAGLVTAAVPAPVLGLVASVAPELMTFPLTSSSGCIGSENLSSELLAALAAGKTVFAIGPGLGQSLDTSKFLAGFLSATQMATVLDADALNILAAKPVLLAKLARGRTLVLTPHPGEMARLAGISTAEVQANRLEVASSFAQRLGVTLVLKGARTLIAHPDGRVAVNTTGNPGMSKGGSGDLLTGLVAGLLAQYPENPGRAVEAAVYLHGLTGDLAVLRSDQHTLLATDSLAEFSRAFRFRAMGLNGYLWIQGLPLVLHTAEF